MAQGVGEAYLNKAKGGNADPMYKEFIAMGGGKHVYIQQTVTLQKI